MKTRKQLLSENTQLRAQLDVHKHVTRKTLNVRIEALGKECKDLHLANQNLTGRVTDLTDEANKLRATLQALRSGAEA